MTIGVGGPPAITRTEAHGSVRSMSGWRAGEIAKRTFVVLIALLAVACLVVGHPHARSTAANAASVVMSIGHSMHDAPAHPPVEPDSPQHGSDNHCAATVAAVCSTSGASGLAGILLALMLVGSVVALARMTPFNSSPQRPLQPNGVNRAPASFLFPGRQALAVLCVSRT